MKFILKNYDDIKDFVDKQVTFVSDASHELRTPLAIVQSKIENILTNPNQSVYDVSEDLAVSLKELSRLNKLTTDLLALARSDQNKLTYNFEKVNINLVLSEIIDPFVEIASFEDRELVYNGVPSEDGTCDNTGTDSQLTTLKPFNGTTNSSSVK